MDNISFDEWAEELQGSKMDLIELLQQHMELVEENKMLKSFKFHAISVMNENQLLKVVEKVRGN